MRTAARERLLLLLAVTAFVAAGSFTSPRIDASYDYLRLHALYKEYLAASLRELRLPLWNPHVGLGRPFLADPETTTLYPPSLVYLLGPTVGLLLSLIAHEVLAVLGMVALARRLGVARGIGYAMAFCFLASGPMVARLQVGQVQFAMATCYLPLLFHLGLGLQDHPCPRRAAALAAALALQLLCGHPQVSWVSGVGLVLLLGGRRLQWPLPARRLAAELGWLGLSALWALGLSAAALLPFLELLGQGNRSAPSLAFSSAFSMSWRSWASLLAPADGTVRVNWENDAYAGILVAVAGVAGLAALRAPAARALLLVAAVAFLLTLGDTPFFAVAYYVMPGLSFFRIPARVAMLVCLALILAAGLWLSDRAASGRARWSLLAGAAVTAALVAEWLLSLRPRGASASWLALRVGAALLASTLLAAWFRLRGREGRWAGGVAVLLGLLLVLDLGLAVQQAKRLYGLTTDLASEALVQRALARPELTDPGGAPPRVSVPPGLARENAGMQYGYSTYGGYVALSLGRVWTYIHAALDLPVPDLYNTFPSPEIYASGPFPFDSMNLVLGYEATGPDLVIRTAPDPRAYVAGEVRLVPSWRDAIAFMRSGIDFHSVALVESAVAARIPPGAGPSGRARIVSFEPERIVVAAESDRGGLLVLAETWYPGWTAQVGKEREVDCIPANAWMRAVPIPPGRHNVVFLYHSRYLLVGAAMTILSTALLAVVLARAGHEKA